METSTISEQPTELTVPTNSQTTSGASSVLRSEDQDSVSNFRKLFEGRKDVVGLSTSRSTKIAESAELDTHFTNHLSGICRMGSYNLLPDGTVSWAMIEFEDHGPGKLDDPKKSSLEAIEHLTTHGISCYREVSKNKSGNCYHLWIFFEKPILAKKVHISLNSFVKNVLGITTEVFPKGFNTSVMGNFVWLPLFPGTDTWGQGLAKTRTLFVDTDGNAYPDQFGFIKTIKRVSESAFDQFITEYKLPTDEHANAPHERESLDADLIKVRMCSFMRHCEANAASLSEPMWYAWITNAIRCAGGREYIHQYGSKHPGYSKQKTDKKIAHALNAKGPMTHQKIEGLGFKCDCPDRFKAPISWSTYVDVQAEATRLATVTDHIELAEGIRKLVSYINQQEPIEKVLGIRTVKQILKLDKSVFNVNLKVSETAELKSILEVMQQNKLDDVKKAKAVFDWLQTQKKAQYFTDECSRHYIYIDQKLIPLDAESSDLQSLLLKYGDVSVATQFGRVVVQVMNASAHESGRHIRRNTWLETKKAELEVYLNLKNGKNELLKIKPDGCCVVQNGNESDGVLMLDTLEDKLKPIQFITLDDQGLKSALEKCESLIVKHIPCVAHEQWFTYAWRMSYALYDFTTMHLILRAQGGPGMGKSTACKILTKSLYGEVYENKNTVASLYSDASVNPLVVEDNLENKAFYVEAGHADFYLSAATGGGKQKRDGASGSGLIIEKIRSLLLCNGIESIAKAEQTSRMMIIECDKTVHNSGYSSAVLLDIERNRDLMLSGEFLITQRVLRRMKEGGWHEIQTRLTTKYPDHPKSRMIEHLAIMVLYLEEFFKGSGKGDDVWELVEEWMDTQKESALTETIESDPIIQALDIIRTSALKQFEYDRTSISDEAKERYQVINLDVRGLLCDITFDATSFSIKGTAGRLHSAFATAVRSHLGTSFAYTNSSILSKRLPSVKNELVEHGYVMTEELDKHNKQKVYTITWDEKKELLQKGAGVCGTEIETPASTPAMVF